ncbi:MAG: response regulator [Phycisphaerae bacterium]|nr:response regulator [Phycisphaerae bacterium]
MSRTPSVDPLNAATDPSAEGAEPIDLSQASILLVDDNLQNLELIQAYLESLPCRVLVAHDGVEAMDLVARHVPDLILLDVMMPRMSGFEVCRRVKSNPATRQIVVIMVTALNEVSDYERAVESGTDDFLSKPVNKLELLTRIRSLLRVSLLRRRLDELMRRDAPRRGS